MKMKGAQRSSVSVGFYPVCISMAVIDGEWWPHDCPVCECEDPFTHCGVAWPHDLNSSNPL